MTFEAIATVLNVPEYARKCPFWLVTPYKGEMWFYSAWDEFEAAQEAAQEDQIILQNGDIKK